jgi:chitinase
MVIAALKSTLGFNGSASSWPSYLTVDLMTMDYGSPSSGVCVVSGGSCELDGRHPLLVV